MPLEQGHCFAFANHFMVCAGGGDCGSAESVRPRLRGLPPGPSPAPHGQPGYESRNIMGDEMSIIVIGR